MTRRECGEARRWKARYGMKVSDATEYALSDAIRREMVSALRARARTPASGAARSR